MNLTELKELCNKYYRECLSLLESRESLSNVHAKLLMVIDLLLKIGEISPIDKKTANKKAVDLFNIARKITKDVSHDGIYYALTNRHLPKVEEPIKEETEVEEINEERVKEVSTSSNNVAESKNILRPLRLVDYIGQDDVKVQLENAIKAAKLRGAPLKHIILFGNAGLGKTTLSRIIANEMGAGFVEMNGPTIRDVQSFVNMFSKVHEGDVVFIDEIHRLPTTCAEAIYSAMEDYQISYFGKNPSSGVNENITLRLPRFTLIGATTHSGMLSKPLLDRFTHQFHLKNYTNEDICKIIEHSFAKLNLECPTVCAMEIAKRSRGLPRKANSYVDKFSDKALLEGTNIIDSLMVEDLFNELKINEDGLDSFDITYLETMVDKYNGGPVGLDTLCSCLLIDKNIVENQIEPYLLFRGLIKVSSSGRELSPAGIDYVNNVIRGKQEVANDNNDKNYYLSLLEDHQYEKLVIALCIKLEGIFKDKFDLNGTFLEMMQDFTVNYSDEHMADLLNKLRMKRNEMVHQEDRNTELSDDEIKECIDYICGLEVE
ncbi:MAG: Holliday junction branch migration DNA helicase RuvB [Bacilli bacterium]|nr:Holliday junction branch migration DNA helicase RuvB [Bacilli bacterium]